MTQSPNEDSKGVTFSVASMMVFTAIVALHLAFPSLLAAIWAAFMMALLLGMILLPVILFAIFASPTDGHRLTIESNPFLNWMLKGYFICVSLTYIVSFAVCLIVEIAIKANL